MLNMCLLIRMDMFHCYYLVNNIQEEKTIGNAFKILNYLFMVLPNGKRSRCAFGNVFHNMIDSIAASLFENNWLSWQIVPDDKIQITLMILGRGGLSSWTRIRSSHQGCQLPCESCEDNISAGESQCRLQAVRSSIPRYLGVVTQSLHILHMSCSCGSLLYINNM